MKHTLHEQSCIALACSVVCSMWIWGVPSGGHFYRIFSPMFFLSGQTSHLCIQSPAAMTVFVCSWRRQPWMCCTDTSSSCNCLKDLCLPWEEDSVESTWGQTDFCRLKFAGLIVTADIQGFSEVGSILTACPLPAHAATSRWKDICPPSFLVPFPKLSPFRSAWKWWFICVAKVSGVW